MLDKISKLIQKYKYADALIASSRFTAISLKDGEADSAREGGTETISCRILLNGSFGFASSNSLEKAEETIKKAEKLARLKGSRIPMAEPEVHSKKIRTAFRKNPADYDFEYKIKLLKRLEKTGRKGKVSTTLLNYHDSNMHTVFLNSHGAEIVLDEIRCGASATMFAKMNGRIESSFDQVKERGGFEIMDRFPPCVEKASKEANLLLKAKHGPRGKMPVILDPELAGVLSHEAVGHACEADAIANDSSCLKGMLGKKIGTKSVTIKDSPVLSPQLWGSYDYDDEGTRAKGTVLVENGVLKSYLTSLESAHAYKNILTGNGRADMHFRQIARMSNTYFERGKMKKEELFDGMEKGVYLAGCKEGQVSPKIGNFTFAAKHGFLIKNGEKKEMIRDCSINGNILQALFKVDAVADDLEFTPGTCGKDAQSAPVTTGSPHLRIRGILVG